MMRQIGFVVFFTLAVSLPAAANPNQTQQFMHNWASSDRCSQRAYQAYPDYTADSLAKRDLELKKCLAGGNLPPRDIPPPNKP